MTKTTVDNMMQMAKLAGEMVEVIAKQEAQVLRLMQAELGALGKFGLAQPKSADPKVVEAETEAGFDNMPV